MRTLLEPCNPRPDPTRRFGHEKLHQEEGRRALGTSRPRTMVLPSPRGKPRRVSYGKPIWQVNRHATPQAFARFAPIQDNVHRTSPPPLAVVLLQRPSALIADREHENLLRSGNVGHKMPFCLHIHRSKNKNRRPTRPSSRTADAEQANIHTIRIHR